MSKAGATMLLSTLFILLSGVATQSHAQDKKVTIISSTPRVVYCTSLSSLLVASNSECEDRKITQIEKALKASSSEENRNTNVVSYELESSYYAPPTPTATIIPPSPVAQTVTPAPQPAENSNNSDTILGLINAHRAQIGKPAFIKEEALCSLAQTRSTELHGELFGNAGYLHSGLYNRNLPYWITENAKWGSDAAGTVTWWLNSPIHRKAIEGDYTYSCGACTGTQCAQLFTSYTPKAHQTPPQPTTPTQ